MNGEHEVAKSNGGLHNIPPRHSLDAIISWLKLRRRQNSLQPLSHLLADTAVPPECLIDLACIDLMERRRHHQQVGTEDYLEDFPQLSDVATRLDLIDAEICIDRELGVSTDPARYTDRFPDLKVQINELLAMPPAGRADLVVVPTDPDPGDEHDQRHPGDEHDQRQSTSDVGRVSAGHSLDFSLAQELLSNCAASPPIALDTGNLRNNSSSSEPLTPIEIPAWFVGAQCIASGPGHWLLRGRDRQRGTALAMKVIELPPQITTAHVDELLDACERAAKVRNPVWVIPAVAAVQRRHLAVVRPWIFANSWRQATRGIPPATRLRQLASIAYALQSAHHAGAAHGAVQPPNLLIDHDALIHLVDCCSATACVRRWLGNADKLASWSTRQHLDVRDMLKLVVSDAVEWRGAWTDKLISQVRGVAEQQQLEACGKMGDVLMQWADQQPANSTALQSTPTTWRSRITKWISREDA